MSLLTHRRTTATPKLVPAAGGTGQESVATAFDPMTCLCGARVPLQVRLGLKSRTRPVLDGRWCCSDKCLESRVASIVRRSLPMPATERPHQHRVPLGLLLLQSRRITREQLRYALEASNDSEDRVGDVLVRDCGLSERSLAAALAQQWGCGAWNVQSIRAESAACFAPRAVLERTGVLPIRILHDGQIGVVFANAPDAQAVLALQRIHDRPVEAGIATATHFVEARDRVLQCGGVPAMEVGCGSKARLVREVVRAIQKQQPVESRWARVHNLFWLRMWLEPAALMQGLQQTEDVVDHVFRMPEGSLTDDEP